MTKKIIALLLCALCFIGALTFPSFAAAGPVIETTLADNMTLSGSKKTFDVFARNSSGEKIKAVVKLNGETLTPTWDDTDKASYTLRFTKEGENIVTVSATSDGGKKTELTYHITYRKAAQGEAIGSAVWSVELFTVGGGYLVYPAEMPIYEGETAAEQLIRLLAENGYVGYYSGTPKQSFYLGYIADGASQNEKYDNYQKSSSPKAPKSLNIKTAVPEILKPYLKNTMTFFDESDYEKNWLGYIGEFVYTNGSGWMYSVNNLFPNVGFSDEYLSDGDVVRVQFTLGYGADIGGLGALGNGGFSGSGDMPESGYFKVADKDDLTALIAKARASGLLDRANVNKAYQNALSAAQTLDASQSAVDSALGALSNALFSPDSSSSSSSVSSSSSAASSVQSSASSSSSAATSVQSSASSSISSSVQSSSPVSSSESKSALEIAEGIINWKKTGSDSFLLNNSFLELAGSTAGDWYPIGLSRLGKDDNFGGYLAVLKDNVEARYKEQGKLSSAKATEWHRIALAVLAAGGDPTDFGVYNGQPIDLIADGVYDRGKTTSLGRQGINGWIWGLIALDSKRYEIPENAYYTREDIIKEILAQQLSDGGFALSGKNADPDITAMALQALSPYYNSEKRCSYTLKSTGEEVEKTVREVADGAVECLSELQLGTGDFKSWGTENVESTDQVLAALCCLGIDPLKDERFIKNGNTLLDGILKYKMSDGGFAHSFTFDPENPAAVPNSSNSMAGEQTLYTMAALWRFENNMRRLYDFRPEQSETLKERISLLESGISEITEDTDSETLERLLTAFYSLPENERSYVDGYWKLSDMARKKGIDIEQIAESAVVETFEENNGETEDVIFSESDKRTAEALPQKLTTEQYVTVTALLDKLERSKDFEGKARYLEKLTKAKAEIAAVQSEIDSINGEILEKLYPYDSITLSDKKTVDEIYARYEALSEYDRTKITGSDDLVKTKTKLDNILRGIIIAVVLGVIAIITAVLLILRIRRRRRKKEREMEELAQRYEDE